MSMSQSDAGVPKADVPKIIWMLWFQGLEHAPEVVKRCYASWKTHHPDWQVVFLDEETVAAYVDVQALFGSHQELPKQALADVVRINLLKTYGGVWVDATCFCCAPLDTWLGAYTRSGFFAFKNPGGGRLLSSWFLASRRGAYMSTKLCEATNAYWRDNRFRKPKRTFVLKALSKVLDKRTDLTGFWFTPVATNILRWSPYYWFHYLFAKLVREDPRFGQLWRETKDYSADVPHKLQAAGLFKAISEPLKREIDSRQTPLYKLTWRYSESKFAEGCTLDYLLHSAQKTKVEDEASQTTVQAMTP